jgi:hypothetical protein
MRLRHAIPAALMALALCGCAGYRLGPTNGDTPGARTVQIVPLTNKTLEPRLGDAVTSAMRREIQRDATFKLATHEAGDIIVNGEVTGYRRRELSFLPNDIIAVQDYRLMMTVQVSARERATGRVLFDKPVTGYTLIRVGSDLVSVERQALPLLAADVAKQVASLLADGGW